MRQLCVAAVVLGLFAGCGEPLRDVARLDQVASADGQARLAEEPVESAPARGGLFSRLFNRPAEDPTNAVVEAAVDEAAASQEERTAEAEDSASDVVEEATAPAPATPRRRGLFGLFRGNSAQDVASNPEVEATPVVAEPRRGLFGRRPAATPGPDAQEVAPGTGLPFGQIARVCGLRRSELGTAIESASGFTIYDTIPNSTGRRPFYITGFDDNCARTFTGAVVISGDIETHEFVRYQPSNERIEMTSVDSAYEALKARICRVGQGEPCGGRSDRLNRNTRFITVYNFFGGTFSAVPTQWVQILLHDGQVLAIDMKEG